MFGSKKNANNNNTNNTNNTNSDADSAFNFDPFYDVNNNDTIDEDKRFSIVNLEKGLLKTIEYFHKL